MYFRISLNEVMDILILELKGKTMIILGLLLFESYSWNIRVWHAKTDFHFV